MPRSVRSYEARMANGGVLVCTAKRRLLQRAISRVPDGVTRLTVHRCTKRGAVAQTLSRSGDGRWVMVAVRTTDDVLLTTRERRYLQDQLRVLGGFGLHW